MQIRSNHRRRNQALVLAALLVALGGAACYNAPTSPYGGGGGSAGGGGGVGGGTTFNLGPFGVSQSAKFTFPNAGTFGYHCIPHRAMGMVGTVQVDGSGADSLVVQIAASGLTFSPATAHIKTGGYVRWVNASGATNHTVTSN